MNKTFFHVSPLMLETGSVLKPGNWGRVIDMYNPHNLNALTARELCYEIMRLKHHPEKPSRFNCIFLLPTYEHAQNYVAKFAFSSIIYEVETIEGHARHFHGNMELIHRGFPSDTIPAIPYLMTLAAEYWTGLSEIIPDSEFLSDTSIRILSMQNMQAQVPS